MALQIESLKVDAVERAHTIGAILQFTADVCACGNIGIALPIDADRLLDFTWIAICARTKHNDVARCLRSIHSIGQ